MVATEKSAVAEGTVQGKVQEQEAEAVSSC